MRATLAMSQPFVGAAASRTAASATVFGLDFTSRPGEAKPITVARCQFDGQVLTVDRLERLESLEAFTRFLERPGPWIAGLDFPFGQPRKLIDDLGWPSSWSEYVRHVGTRSREGWRDLLEDYQKDREAGDREHLRLTDRLAGAQSPSKLYGVPVGLMFYEGARRLEQSRCSVVPVRRTSDPRIVVEVYPALVARALAADAQYKPDAAGRQIEGREIRRQMLGAMLGGALREPYGFEMALQPDPDQFVNDPSGDSIDALFAAIQAAWAWQRRDDGFGCPQDCDPAEGWIVDPVTRPSRASSLTRVRPVFRQLLRRDPSGGAWLPDLLGLAAGSEIVDAMRSAPGTLLSHLSAVRSFDDPVQGECLLENCFERPVAPSAGFLEWLIRNPEALDWTSFDAATESQRETTRRFRLALRDPDTRADARARALKELRLKGSEGSHRKWWGFERFSRIDCCLETDTLLLLIEGRRSGSMSDTTFWYAGRNQVHRSLEAARDLANGRQFGVLVVAETPMGSAALGDPDRGLPHLSAQERHDLLKHYLGWVTWAEVCRATGVEYASLPRDVARRRHDLSERGAAT
jgi:hypothetical protein